MATASTRDRGWTNNCAGAIPYSPNRVPAAWNQHSANFVTWKQEKDALLELHVERLATVTNIRRRQATVAP